MNFSKVNRSFIEIYSILSSQWMHKWIGKIETMSILEIMKITRKKKKIARSLWNWNIIWEAILLIIPFFEMATFAILLRFILFSLFLELITIDETFRDQKIREEDLRSNSCSRWALWKNEEADLFVRIIIIR